MQFLADIPLYDVEKPYYAMPAAANDIDPSLPTTNLEFETHNGLLFRDARGREDELTLGRVGFQIVNHTPKNLILESAEQLAAYKLEIEEFLKEKLGGVHAVCYESKESLHYDLSTYKNSSAEVDQTQCTHSAQDS